MTGHMYKKKRTAASGEGITEEHCVFMNDGDASSSCTGDSDRGSVQQKTRPVTNCTTFRQYMDDFLHTTKVQVLIVALVVLCCLVVIVELLIELKIFELFDGSSNRSDSPDRTAVRVLFFVNVAILSIFVLEMAAKILAMGLRFLKHRMELFDFVVVVLAFSLGLAFSPETQTRNYNSASDRRGTSVNGIGLLIMLRLWRVSKILNSMVASVRAESERKMGKERRARRALEREVAKLREYCLQQECELQMYRMLLQQNQIPQPTVLRPPTAPRTLSVIAEVNEGQLDNIVPHGQQEVTLHGQLNYDGQLNQQVVQETAGLHSRRGPVNASGLVAINPCTQVAHDCQGLLEDHGVVAQVSFAQQEEADGLHLHASCAARSGDRSSGNSTCESDNGSYESDDNERRFEAAKCLQ